MDLNQGNKFEVIEDKEKFVPVTTYSERFIKKLKNEVKEIENSIKNGKTPIFDSIDSLFEKLDK